MLSGFANENMSQNRFMARTRQLNSSFSNAIGTKEVTPLPNIYRNMRKAPINQVYANAYGNPVQKASRPLVFNPNKNIGGGFANAIGKTTYVKPSPTPPLALAGCNPSSSYTCMNCAPSGGSPSWCPSGVSSIYGPAIDQAISECGCTAISTRPTSRPTNVSVKFDGGFDYASGSNGDPILGL